MDNASIYNMQIIFILEVPEI